MPLINVIRGETVPVAPLNVRTPFVKLPIWLVVVWEIVKALYWTVTNYIRHWYATLPLTGLTWLYLAHGWQALALLVGGTAAAATGWSFAHRPSWLRFGWWPALAKVRRFVYRRRWMAAMVTANLSISYDKRTIIPQIRRVRCRAGGCDEVLVRMVTGQIPDDFAKASERLAQTFGVRQVKAIPGPSYGSVVLVLMRGDTLSETIDPFPVPAVPDFTALPIGVQEDGGLYRLRLFGTQVLIVGATGSGKGSAIWSIVRALAGGVAAGVVEAWLNCGRQRQGRPADARPRLRGHDARRLRGPLRGRPGPGRGPPGPGRDSRERGPFADRSCFPGLRRGRLGRLGYQAGGPRWRRTSPANLGTPVRCRRTRISGTVFGARW
ncbi:hypothetical protein [Actinoplanes siamensis]|uniref:FtsK domain-containing protein n=1 Tax=Actinoplanes siamensis TaxID=1223317 RepID=A0A919TP67_9ACTN|nr:hypothetical protein [Actinoplanes siamensis]GIF09519.1 hypothetical protein Asi03nite_70570 [Actinoplanes siamensis]